ncbi:DUF305 domain-containing protein [Actinoplanes sp. NPDC026619]|uniref:DUF305 domain-containing protein n=1 Tax=Actinoplanes sp. NPDC026619 TaxID=3155798 RepID=UPI0033F042E2
MRRVSIALVATLLLAGCGTQQSSSPSPAPATADALGAGPRHNDADVAFVRALIPHHQQGIALASAAAAENPQARTLAEAIIVTQQDEAVRMTGWLTTWGVAPPPSAAPAPPAGDPVQALISHQEKAVELAQQEQANGANLTALAFAKQIIESRTGEIAQLSTYRD